ncbi:MAG: hypothetical protein JNM97_13505, partial [Rhodoferax sp.]|nr:hypothetical protein [Rhodoferax sp.]
MNILLRLGALALVSVLSACGGGGGGTVAGGSGGGVGSGGTGISVGPITGFGSIIVNGITYDTQTATITTSDSPSLQLGMTVEVAGTVQAGLTTGTATSVVAAADLRGTIDTISLAPDQLTVLGTTVSTDSQTVVDGAAAFANLQVGDRVQVYGLVDAAGSVRATRIELLPGATTPVLSGQIQNLNTGATTFQIGTLTVQYGTATFAGGLTAGQLATDLRVRVRAAADPVAGVLTATQIQLWHGNAQPEGSTSSVTGVVTDFASLGAFRVLGAAVDASSAQITGGPAGSIGNGVKVEIVGTVRNGVLEASRVAIR